MILWFSGTGNSQYIAEGIADILADECIDSKKYIKHNEKAKFQSDKPWIFVFPIYLSTIAELFADFIRRSQFSGNDKAYFIATCAASMGATANVCEKICMEKGLDFMGADMVCMPQNYVALFKLTEPEEVKHRLDNAKIKIQLLAEQIRRGDKLTGRKAGALETFATKLVEKMYNGPFTGTRKFRTTDKCVGCGLCERVCPLNRISMVDNRPVWNGSCIHCMGCINRCPKQAIEYGSKTIGKGRYVCPLYKTEDSD